MKFSSKPVAFLKVTSLGWSVYHRASNSLQQSQQEDNIAGPECEICYDQIPGEDRRNQFRQDIQSETRILAVQRFLPQCRERTG